MIKSTYTNHLNQLAKNRICSDRNIVLQDKKGYSESDIFFHFNDENIIDNEFRMLTIGSRDISNPYFGGFFFFYGNFPDQYPFFPPHILAKTQGEGTRFHPNFYVSGKCCLSILGTWSGPPWTSCQNIGTTAQTLKSLFIENPITQEPGWEKCVDSRAISYTRVIEYRTLKVAVLGMLNNPPNGFEAFLPIMKETFIELYPTYIEKLDHLMIYNGKTFTSPIYNSNHSMKQVYNITLLKTSFQQKYKELTSKKKTKKSPNEMAKEYSIGYKQQSTNDGHWWIVSENKNGVKRWIKCKD